MDFMKNDLYQQELLIIIGGDVSEKGDSTYVLLVNAKKKRIILTNYPLFNLCNGY